MISSLDTAVTVLFFIVKLVNYKYCFLCSIFCSYLKNELYGKNELYDTTL